MTQSPPSCTHGFASAHVLNVLEPRNVQFDAYPFSGVYQNCNPWLAEARFDANMPVAIETFVQRCYPQAERVEFCHTKDRMVLRRGWSQLADGLAWRAKATRC